MAVAAVTGQIYSLTIHELSKRKLGKPNLSITFAVELHRIIAYLHNLGFYTKRLKKMT